MNGICLVLNPRHKNKASFELPSILYGNNTFNGAWIVSLCNNQKMEVDGFTVDSFKME